MNFNTIENSISYSDVEKAKLKFSKLLVDLGVRKNNEHCGSGMGGDNFLLLVLLSLKHNLCLSNNEPIVFDTSAEVMTWSASWLNNSSLKTIRVYLNEYFPKVTEPYKYLGLIAETVGQNNNLFETAQQYQEHFPNLTECLKGNYFNFSPKLSNIEQLIQAYIICQDLAQRLDRGDTSMVRPSGAALLNFSPEIILMSVRKFIGIMRLVHFNLDEDPVFAQVIHKVNNLVD